MKERICTSYLTSPKLKKYLDEGFRFVEDYGNYCLYEKVVKDEVLYRECFHKFDLYGAEWANDTNNFKPKKRKRKSKRFWKVGVFKMTQEEFIEKMRELDPFHDPDEPSKTVSLDLLYDRFNIVVEEMERLEDIEDNTIELKAHIDYLNERLQEAQDVDNEPRKK